MTVTGEFAAAVERIASLGHEIGLHNNATTVELVTGRPADEVLQGRLAELRELAPVTGTASHGDALRRSLSYTNLELYDEHRNAVVPLPAGEWRIPSWPLRHYGLDYDCDLLGRPRLYVCDSGGDWGYGGRAATLEQAADGFPHERQIHMLMHPEWWDLGVETGHRRAFRAADLAAVQLFLDQTDAAVPMREVAVGNRDPRVIGLRHDVDSDLPNAVRLAEWEAERDYRSTYFFLHTSDYWNEGPPLDRIGWMNGRAPADCLFGSTAR